MASTKPLRRAEAAAMDWADRFSRFVISTVEKRLTMPKQLREALVEQLAVSLRAAWRQRYARLAPPTGPASSEGGVS